MTDIVEPTGDLLMEPSRPASSAGRGRWVFGALFVAGLVLLPVLSIVWIAFNPVENIWPHLLSTVLPRYVSNTLTLMVGVGIGTTVGGITTAWLPATPVKSVASPAVPGWVVQYTVTAPLAPPVLVKVNTVDPASSDTVTAVEAHPNTPLSSS